MKLALVRQTYNPFGGAERFVERALSALSSQSLEVTLITRQWKGAQDGRAVHICNPFYLGRLWRDASFASAVQGIAQGGEFDLIQSHERIPGCDIYRAGDGVHSTWLDLRARIQSPLMRWATRLNLWHAYTVAVERQMFLHPQLRAVICNSAMVKNDIIRRFGLPAEKLHVIHNGVDLDYFHLGLRAEHRSRMRAELGLKEETPVVLFVGSGFERKGVPQLLQALVGLPQAAAVIVGRDRKLKAMQALAKKLGVSDRVHFVGGQQDVRPYYGMADVFALPTLYDPFPNAVLEALACGLPVVTSTTSGAAEVIAGRTCGRVCDALDVAGLRFALDELLKAEAGQVADLARQSVADMGQADLANRLGELYQSLFH